MLTGRHGVTHARGLGLMQAVVLEGPDARDRAVAVSRQVLRKGVIVLAEGPAVAITPPLMITEAQLDHALGVIEDALASR